MRPLTHRFVLSAIAGALLAAAGCGGDAAQRTAPAAVRVTERDFAIHAPKRLHPGDVELAVRNKGPDAHELIIVRSGRSPLRLRSDGSTVDEEALERAEVGALEPGEPGGLRRLRVKLRTGRYELFCNMAGHYLGGMHARLVVQ